MTSTSSTNAAPAVTTRPLPMETIAWLVLVAAFGAFLFLAAAAMAGVRWYYITALEPRPAQAQTIAGTLLARSSAELSWLSLPAQGAVQEGQTVRTDGTSQALLTLLDYSTLTIGSGTELTLTRMGVSRFTSQRQAIRIDLVRGRVHIGVAAGSGPERKFTVGLPAGTAELEEGSYSLTAGDGQSTVRVSELGGAVVRVGSSDTMALMPGQRLQWEADGTTAGPQAGPDELLYNGDFAWGLQGWRAGSFLGFPEGGDVAGKVTLITGQGGRPVVNFSRRFSRSTHHETYLFQDIGKDVSDYAHLTLTLKFRLVYQSLSGGGYMGSEYPIAVRAIYRAANGVEHTAFTGFYYHNTTANRIDSGQSAPENLWRTIEIPLKGDISSPAIARRDPRPSSGGNSAEGRAPVASPGQDASLSPPYPQPQYIISIQVSASGWDYESELESISLTGW